MTATRIKQYGYFHPKLRCTVRRLNYDFTAGIGEIYLAEGACTDFSRCIEFFSQIDPEVRSIDTYSGDKPDVSYIQIAGEWGIEDHSARRFGEEHLGKLLQALRAVFGEDRFGVTDVARKARWLFEIGGRVVGTDFKGTLEDFRRTPDGVLRQLLSEIGPPVVIKDGMGKPGEDINRISLGAWFKRHEEKCVNGLRLVRIAAHSKSKGSAQWKILEQKAETWL